MKYFVAHLLSGDAKRYHETLTRELAERYRIIPLHDRIPPHMTVKAPFEADETGIKDVERILRSLAHHEKALPLSIRGFGRFGFRTIYLDVHKNQDAVLFARRCIQALNTNLTWMPRAPLEGNKLHASVARFLNRRQFRRIWRTVRELHPRFEVLFDNIAILKKEDRLWQLHTLIPIRHSDSIEYGSASMVSDMVEYEHSSGRYN